jgi:hypothetical protein
MPPLEDRPTPEPAKPDTPRNVAERIIGREALAALDSHDIGVYSRPLLLIKQRRMVEMARLLALPGPSLISLVSIRKEIAFVLKNHSALQKD